MKYLFSGRAENKNRLVCITAECNSHYMRLLSVWQCKHVRTKAFAYINVTMVKFAPTRNCHNCWHFVLFCIVSTRINGVATQTHSHDLHKKNSKSSGNPPKLLAENANFSNALIYVKYSTPFLHKYATHFPNEPKIQAPFSFQWLKWCWSHTPRNKGSEMVMSLIIWNMVYILWAIAIIQKWQLLKHSNEK